jgi:hypothetical protein
MADEFRPAYESDLDDALAVARQIGQQRQQQEQAAGPARMPVSDRPPEDRNAQMSYTVPGVGQFTDTQQNIDRRAAKRDYMANQSWPAQALQAAKQAFTLPGRVYEGNAPAFALGQPISDEAIGEALNFALTFTGGAGAFPVAAKGTTLRAGAGLYSKSLKVAQEATQNKMTGEQALAMLKKAGVTPEELKWTQLDQILPQTPKITKDELAALIQKNDVPLNEEVFQRRNVGTPSNAMPTRYHDYALPGSHNYEETVISLPEKYLGIEYQEPHWQGQFNSPAIPNVVAHIRTNEFWHPEGKIFNLDEAQSQLAQTGRKEGFYDPLVLNEQAEKVEKLRENWLQEERKLKDIQYFSTFNSDEYLRQREISNKARQDFRAVYEEYNKERGEKKMPLAPYVGSTSSWLDLSLKKALQKAVNSNADIFTITPGEIQANRYSLSNVADTVKLISPVERYNPDEYQLVAFKDGKPVAYYYIDSNKLNKELPSYLGKELAEKILAQEEKSNRYDMPERVLKGDELIVGGHGMKDFYNNIVPKQLKALVKKLTGQEIKFDKFKIPTSNGGTEAVGFRMTPEIQKALLERGIPHFAKGGAVPKINYGDDPDDMIQDAIKLASRG